MNKVTKAELARQFNVNQSRINALLSGEKPKLVETADGFIDLDNPQNKAYIKTREITVPKYTGIGIDNSLQDEDEDVYTNVKADNLPTKKDLETKLIEIKISKEEKANRLLELNLDKELKRVVDVEILQQILTKSYEYFYRLLQDKPRQQIDKLRHIILSGENKNDEDVQLWVDTNITTYKEGLEQTRKAMLSLYELEDGKGTD